MPTLFTLTKTYSGPEDEAASGPNFRTFYPMQYTIEAEIAPGQSLTSLVLSDLLPGNLQFFALISSSPGGASCTTPGASPGGTVQCSFPDPVSGSASMTFDFYVPRDPSGGGRVIDPVTGNDATSCDNASVSAAWTPLDPRDSDDAGPVSSDPDDCEHSLTDKSLAIQKSVASFSGGIAPGGVLQYTHRVQISDFFAFGGIVIDRYPFRRPAFRPRPYAPYRWPLRAMASRFRRSAMNAANLDVACDYTGGPGPECTIDNSGGANTGETTLTFRLSAELLSRGQPNGNFVGGCIDPATGSPDPDCNSANPGGYNNGPTYAVVTYHARILDEFTDSYLVPPNSEDASVDQGDVLGNDVTIRGDVLNTATFLPTGQTEDDDSGAGLSVGTGTLEKSIYALNGSTSFSSPLEVKPGDEVTYRITYTLPISDVENLEFNDYLPLPVFHVDDPDEDGSPGPAWTFDPTVSDDSPLSGVAKFGPDDTFYGFTCSSGASGTPPGCLPPTLTSNATNNRLRFFYGDFSDTRQTATMVDLLFTVTVSDEPFADRLFLTNQVASIEGSTNAGEVASSEIEQIVLTQPVLVSTKGVIWTSNVADIYTPSTVGPVTFLAPGSSPRWSGTINSTNLAADPIDSDVSGVDAGDTVSFAITIENTGSSLNGAFDIALRDDLPALFQIPAGGPNLQVYYGNGSGPIDYTGLGGGPDGFDDTPDDLFGDGIQLTDPVGAGVCQAHDPNLGNNIILVTFDLQVRDDVPPGSVIDNTSSLDNYAGSEGGPNHLAEAQTDTASVTIASPVVTKTILGTNQLHTTGSNVAIGEQVQYRAVITVPEGEADNVTLVDTLDSGLAFVSLDSLAASPGLSTSIAAGFPQVLTNAQAALVRAGQQRHLRLRDADERQPGRTPRRKPSRSSTPSSCSTAPATTGASDATTPPPGRGPADRCRARRRTWSSSSRRCRSSKTALPNTGDAGDEIVYSLVVLPHGGQQCRRLRGDAERSSCRPASRNSAAGWNAPPACRILDSFSEAAGVITATWTGFPDDGTSSAAPSHVILDDDVEPGQVITNTAALAWSSLPGDVTAPQSSYNSVSTERTGNTGNPGGAENDYVASGNAPVTILQVPEKSITTTSESHTAEASNNAPVAIGEIVRYHLAFQLAEGLATNIRFEDVLPAGLRFIDDGTADVAFVSNGAGISSSTINSGLPGCGGLNISGASGAVTPTCPLPDAAVSASDSSRRRHATAAAPMCTSSSATRTTVTATSMANTSWSTSTPWSKTPGRTCCGTTLDNHYVPRVGSSAFPQSADASVIVNLPSLTVSKALTIAPSDAGDALQYTITVTAASGANRTAAFDISLSDTLDARLQIVAVTAARPAGRAA